MTRRSNAIRATVSMNIALTNSLLVFSKNYLEALRYVLYWLKERKINPNKRNILSIKASSIFIGFVFSSFNICGGIVPTIPITSFLQRNESLAL
jgi:hypothetical protein